jgi:hypothetical protein
MRPGNRVRYIGPNQEDVGKTGTVEWISGQGVKCNVVWDDGRTAFLPIAHLELEPCVKINGCPKIRMVLDKSYDVEGLYQKVIQEVCAMCEEKAKSTEELPF